MLVKELEIKCDSGSTLIKHIKAVNLALKKQIINQGARVKLSVNIPAEHSLKDQKTR